MCLNTKKMVCNENNISPEDIPLSSIYSISVVLFIHQYQGNQKHLSNNKGSINKVAFRPLRDLKEKNQCVCFDFFKTFFS